MTKHRTIFILFLFAVQIALDGGLTGVARAGDIFSVDKIAVEATANTSAEARDLALLGGQRKGLMTVLRKLTQEQNWPELPDPQLIDPEPYVLGFRVSDEKSSPRKYEANLSVSFNPDSLRLFLRDHGLSVSEVQAPTILLLPILEDQFDVRLWTENWWRSLWASQDLNNITTPFILPLGDIGDTATAGENDILLGDRLKIDLLKHRYGVDTAIVAHALADIEGQLGVTVYTYGPEFSDVQVYSYAGVKPHDMMAQDAIYEILRERGESWKQITSVGSDDVTQLSVRASFENLDQFLEIEEKLSGADLIRQITILELSVYDAVFDLGFVGSVAQISRSLRQSGLSLSPALQEYQLNLIR